MDTELWFSRPPELVQELCLLLLLEAGASGAVWVIVGEVGGASVLRVFQAHVQAADADSSVDLAGKEDNQWFFNRPRQRRSAWLGSSVQLRSKQEVTDERRDVSQQLRHETVFCVLKINLSLFIDTNLLTLPQVLYALKASIRTCDTLNMNA